MEVRDEYSVKFEKDKFDCDKVSIYVAIVFSDPTCFYIPYSSVSNTSDGDYEYLLNPNNEEGVGNPYYCYD